MAKYGTMLAFLQNIGATELIIIGIIALLFFGRRLPEVGRSLGQGIVEFKKGLKDTGDELKKEMPSKDDLSIKNPVSRNDKSTNDSGPVS